MICFNRRIGICRKDLAEIRAIRNRLESEDWDIQMQSRDLFESVQQDEDEFIEGRYSRAVYDCYAKWGPDLTCLATGRNLMWKDVFGTSYEETTIEQRHDLAGLIEGGGRYRFRWPQLLITG